MVRARFNVDKMLRLANVDNRIAVVANQAKANYPHVSDKEILRFVYNTHVLPNADVLNTYNRL